MSVSDTLFFVLQNAEQRTGQKKARMRTKLKNKIVEMRDIFFPSSKGVKLKKENRQTIDWKIEGILALIMGLGVSMGLVGTYIVYKVLF